MMKSHEFFGFRHCCSMLFSENYMKVMEVASNLLYGGLRRQKSLICWGGGQINDILAREDAVLFRSFKQLPPLFLIPLRIV